MSSTTYVGIDPGATTGVCIKTPIGSIRSLSLDFWDTIDLIQQKHKERGLGLCVVVEKTDMGMHWKKYPDLKGKSLNYICTVAQKVGMNMRDARLLIEYLKKNNIRHRVVKPTKSKLNAAKFKKVTGFEYRNATNQHERDAAMLIWKLK